MSHHRNHPSSSRHPRRLLLVATAGALSLGLAACSSGGSTSSGSSGGSTSSGSATSSGGSTGSTSPGSSGATATAVTITIKNFAFQPASMTVKPGATVTVTNNDSVTHTLTSNTGAFDTGNIAAGASAHFTAPMQPGSYPYHCTIHQYMTGTLVVSSS